MFLQGAKRKSIIGMIQTLRFQEPRGYTARRLRTLPHEGEPFTQGLEVVDEDTLIETSGAYPAGTQSLIRGPDLHELM